MINEERLAQIRTRMAAGESLKDPLKDLSEDELFRLKGEIESLLPAQDLNSLNLEKELAQQYTLVKRLQNDVLNNEEIPLNQRSQLAGQVASTLQQLIKMQSEYHTAERFKSIEALMIKYMRKLPKEVAEAFLNEYEGVGQ